MVADFEALEHLYPFTSRFFERHGLRQHYVDEGHGEPVVMVHGNPTWSFYFRELVKTLRGTHRAIAVDHIGCGLSDKPGDDRYDYRLKSRIDDLEALLDHLGVKQNITLVLHDWGGAIGMGYAARHPERIARIILGNTYAFRVPAAKSIPPGLWLGRNTALGALLIRGGNAFALSAALVCAKKGMSKAVRKGFLAPYDSWQNRIATLRFVQDIPLAPGDPSYPTLQAIEEALPQFTDRPMLICWGERDFVFDRHFLAEWRRRFPNAEVHAFPDCGHYILEDARRPMLGLIQDFLRRNPIRSG